MSPSDENAWIVIGYIFNFCMMFTPTLAYFAQVVKIKNLKINKGYSIKIGFFIIISSILRIFFWFGKKFHWSLLGQSVFMTLMQLFMVYICLKYNPLIEKMREQKFKTVFYIRNFWDWGYLRYYIIFLILFSSFVYMFCFIFTFEDLILVETIGFLSVLCEAFLVLPQVYTNYKEQATRQLSVIVIANWVFGDVTKSFYFFMTSAPIQLILCGLTQLFIDFIVLFQIWYYRKNNKAIKEKEKLLKKQLDKKKEYEYETMIMDDFHMTIHKHIHK